MVTKYGMPAVGEKSICEEKNEQAGDDWHCRRLNNIISMAACGVLPPALAEGGPRSSEWRHRAD